MNKHILCFCLILALAVSQLVKAQEINVKSPNNLIKVTLQSPKGNGALWSLKIDYKDQAAIVPEVSLGLQRSDADFSHGLKLNSVGNIRPVHDQYISLHGKKSLCTNEANELTLHFTAANKQLMDIVLRVYNDGVAFRYRFPDKNPGTYRMMDELTSFRVPDTAKRWLQKFVRSYEGFYPEQDDNFKYGEWGYPGLFQFGHTDTWALLTEADLDRNYCATKLTNTSDQLSTYKLTFPSAGDGNRIGDVNPSFSLPWQSPWRTLIIGGLKDIVQSTLAEDLSKPQIPGDFSWVEPGISSWVYWAYNHGTKDYQKLAEYTDLAARMGWKYTLFDWEWDQMSNGGDVQKAAEYALSKGIKPLIWYNSGGNHNTVPATPKDRLLTHESRVKEFEWLKKLGFYGVKVDFFESDKQNIINYFIDLLEDAAKYKLMIYFHGATVPRGWTRTYPNLMTVEGVAGAEQYNNGPVMTTEGPKHNATLPFTRNVIGPMDYTPVTFTNSQHTHTTSWAHELALAVVFESGIQHFADRPAGYDNLPFEARRFLTMVPAAWDDIRLISGYPGKSVVLARKKDSKWFLGGINGENRGGRTQINLNFLPKGKKYRLTLIGDGDNDEAFKTQYSLVDNETILPVLWLPRGGFAGYLEEF